MVAGVLVGIFGAVAAFTLLAGVDVGEVANRSTGDVAITANFGLRRDALTSSYTTPLCDPNTGKPWFPGVQECPDEGGGTTPANATTTSLPGGSAGNEAASVSRPSIVSATVVGDLKRVDPNQPLATDFTCRVLDHGQTFPANQLSAVSQNLAFRDLAISLKADPGQPTEVRAGTYCGYVVVARSDRSEIAIPIVATVSSRGQMSLRLRVFLTLLFGALLGAAVKWMGEKYAPVAGLRRRQRRLIRRFGDARRFLPERAQYDLAVIGDGISSLEPDGVEDRLIELEQQGDALAQFAAAMQDLELQLNRQKEPDSKWPDVPPVAHVRVAERARAMELGETKFPWADPDKMAGDANRLRSLAEVITTALHEGDVDAYGEVARELGADPDEADPIGPERHGKLELRFVAPVQIPHPEPRSFADFLLDNSLLLTMVVGAVVVATVGFQTQFVDNAQFDNGNGTYLKLFAWAFALQLAGVTVLEVAGKLVTSATARAAPAPPSGPPPSSPTRPTAS